MLPNSSSFVRGQEHGPGTSWFSLWTGQTAIDLFSAGGNLSPNSTGLASDLAVVYPSILRATAASGSLYYGKAGSSSLTDNDYKFPLLLAPGVNGQLQLLAMIRSMPAARS